MKKSEERMKNTIWKKIGGGVILGGALLLIGATSLKNRSLIEKKQLEQDRCREAAVQLEGIAPGSNWKEMALRNPEFCIRAGHTVLRGTNGKVTE